MRRVDIEDLLKDVLKAGSSVFAVSDAEEILKMLTESGQISIVTARELAAKYLRSNS